MGRVKRHEDIPGRGPSPARHARIKEWAEKRGYGKLPPGQVPTEIEIEYTRETGDEEGME